MGSSKFINQEIQTYYLTAVVHNGMAAHLTAVVHNGMAAHLTAVVHNGMAAHFTSSDCEGF